MTLAGTLSADPAVATELADFYENGKGRAWVTALEQMARRGALLGGNPPVAEVVVADSHDPPLRPAPFAYRPGAGASAVLEAGDRPALRVLNLGAGVQSTAMALMAAHGELPMPDAAVFADTGAEPDHVYQHVAKLRTVLHAAGLPLVIVRNGDLLADLLALAGPEPGRIAQPPFFVEGADAKAAPLRRACTHDYKVVPVTRWIREQLGVPAGRPFPDVAVEQWFGMTTDEVERMRDPHERWAVNYYPLVDAGMNRQDCEAWLTDHGYEVPGKSACSFCPYRRNHALAEMRDNDPAAWAVATTVDQVVRDTVPGVRGRAYVHRKLIPLQVVAVDGTPGQAALFDAHGDCEGVCEW